MDRKRFEQLVAAAVESLPEELSDRLENLTVVVEEYPSHHQLSKSRLKAGHTLLGLYEGVPLTKRTHGYSMVPPDKITIFQKAIESRCKDETEIAEEINRVVLHEIAHHFGISDTKLTEIEKAKYSLRKKLSQD